MVIVLASSVENHGYKPRVGQFKAIKLVFAVSP